MPIAPVTPPTPLEVASERLSLYLKAERAILENQAYEINGRRLTRADLDVVRQQITALQGEVSGLTRVVTARGRFGYIRHGDRR